MSKQRSEGGIRRLTSLEEHQLRAANAGGRVTSEGEVSSIYSYTSNIKHVPASGKCCRWSVQTTKSSQMTVCAAANLPG